MVGSVSIIMFCVEGFLYGVYSGIFIIYLMCSSRESRTATTGTVFYALCLLYILSTVTIASDLLIFIVETRLSTLPAQLQIDSQSMLLRLTIVEASANSCCDFIAQCTLIYRCWIVWGKNIRVMIIPSFLAITSIVTWLASESGVKTEQDGPVSPPWGNTLILTGLVASMAVNAMVTGLIVFKILKVFLETKRLKTEATSVERTLASLSSTTSTKLRHIIFIIIESGMALFAIQLVRVVVVCLIELQAGATDTSLSLLIAMDFALITHQMFNGIAPTIILVRVSMRLSYDEEESFKEAVGSLRFNNPPSDPNSLQQVGSNSSMPPQEKNEDICFDNPPSASGLNIIVQVRRGPVGSTSMLPQDTSEDT